MNGPTIAWLPDGRRLHMNHGPIDLIVEAFGDAGERQKAYAQAERRFRTILEELVSELGELRRPATAAPRPFRHATARRMEAAVAHHFPAFVTPMAAVAGSVADEVLAALCAGRDLNRAYVNNGGDVAFHLAPGETIDAAVAGTGNGFADRLTVDAESPIRGIATSGWRGRSHSLGIADAVTVLAASAAEADVAATLIADAVDLPGHPAIRRVPARDIDPDSDLGDRPVTEAVGPLSDEETGTALEAGLSVAAEFAREGRIAAAALFLNGEARVCGRLEAPRRAALANKEEALFHA